MVLIKYLKY
uniref:Uncharacterized protein n=1 Tax=Anguilla anguilla TaxID=7936 RepID=A0A0E9SR78_ANGAN